MKRADFVLYSVLALACCFAIPQATAAPDFSGSWKMNAAKSDYGPLPAPDKYEQTIDHKDPVLKIAAVQVGQQGEMKSDLTYSSDGKENTNKMRGNDVKTTGKWDGDTLTFNTKLDFQGAEITLADKWTLSADGKTLTIDRHINSPQGELDQKIVFEKQ